MVEVIVDEQRLFFRFTFAGLECSEEVGLPASEKNIVLARRLAGALEDQIRANTFRYSNTFPSSQIARMLSLLDTQLPVPSAPSFECFANRWYEGRRIEWRQSYADTTRLTLDKYLIPSFGSTNVDAVTKDDLLSFRRDLGSQPGLALGSTLSANRVNKIMLPLRMIMIEAADQLGFVCPWRGIKSIREPRGLVHPLTLTEVSSFLDSVRSDFRPYFAVRFLTGLRSSEINGLDWAAVDLTAGKLHVCETLVNGKLLPPKNNESNRMVFLAEQAIAVFEELSYKHESRAGLVFRGKRGGPLNNAWLTNHIWYPALKSAGLKPRRPYQTRHTTATLWLAAGENPQWIANQLGHTTTEMLFRIYSRYVPNTIRKDGSLIEPFIRKSWSALEGQKLCNSLP